MYPAKRMAVFVGATVLASIVSPAAMAQTTALTPVPARQATTARNPASKSSDNTIQAARGEHITVNRRMATGTNAQYNHTTASLGPLGNRSILDTPFSIMTVTQDIIANQQARNVNDLAAYMPSVQLEIRGDPNTSRPQSRGFEADVVSNSRMDGLNMVITTPYAAEQFDSLQVLNGLAGALYGPQNPAGTFDYSLKRPTDRMTERLTVGVDSIGAPLESGDFSGRVGRNGWFGYRLNLLNQQGMSYVEGSHIRRNLVSGDFDIHLSPNTVIQIDASQYSYAERGFAGQFSYGPTIQLPNAPDLSNRGYGQSQGGYNAETNTALAKIIHHFNDDWSLTLGGLYQNAYRDVFTVANQLTDNRGDYNQTISAAATAKNFKVGSNLAYLNGRFYTGPLKHEIELGSNGYTMGNYNPTLGQSFSLGKANINDPKVVSSPQPYFSGNYKSADTTNQSLLAGDTISLGKHWSIMGTLAWSWLSTNNYNTRNVKTSSYSRNAAFSPMTSLIYKPAANQSAYFTWGRALEAGPTAPAGAANVNEVLAPLRSEEYEVGYKYLVSKRLQLNVAAFRMTRPYGYTDPTTNVFGTFGNQRNYGVEFQAAGSVTRDLSVFGGMTWMDAQLGSTGVASTSHKEVVGVPPVQANVIVDYRLPFLRGAAVNANVHYTGRRAANVTNTTFAGSYVTLDLGTRYATRVYDEPIVFRFGVNNVTNQSYWASVYPSSINGGGSATNAAVAGLPRIYHFTIELDF
ncbi:ferric siderophore receptor [Tanticharoenia sakaeratensis NBRC 103193]|uniref:Ferric siderophore receptor n=2 Tax=Tanticharoenia TaxID=444052 RepID=A0A0D6MKR1_9PROT|nr:ferric siderophore receptor [Tanticharoenia sakaeratensis NBRC 103193]GBQ23682.1 TonB-dependent ferric iron siderophore receptor [Tanticharoenia sakaeratensis NBRC 103193]